MFCVYIYIYVYVQEKIHQTCPGSDLEEAHALSLHRLLQALST